MAKKKLEEFNYVVARLWYEDEPDNLCIYAYGSEVHRGTIKDAQSFLDYVKRGNKDEAKEYSIYKVNFEKIEG